MSTTKPDTNILEATLATVPKRYHTNATIDALGDELSKNNSTARRNAEMAKAYVANDEADRLLIGSTVRVTTAGAAPFAVPTLIAKARKLDRAGLYVCVAEHDADTIKRAYTHPGPVLLDGLTEECFPGFVTEIPRVIARRYAHGLPTIATIAATADVLRATYGFGASRIIGALGSVLIGTNMEIAR